MAQQNTVVSDAAAWLQVSEFEVFKLAYRLWYGRVAPESALGPHFTRYLQRGDVPPWVRHYCRSQHSVANVPAAVQASPVKCLAVGAYFLLSLLTACAVFVFY